MRPNPHFAARPATGWLPTAIDFAKTGREVAWVKFGHDKLSEPLFTQSVDRVMSAASSSVCEQDIRSLGIPRLDIPIAGFIFHISRCGSTLLSNMFRAATNSLVIAEAAIVDEAVFGLLRCNADESWLLAREPSKLLLMATVNAFRERRSSDEEALVVKFTSWNIVAIKWVRAIWPAVPIIIVIRDPVEVMVSCLKKPPGWFQREKISGISDLFFGIRHCDVNTMTREQLCARAIGCFLAAAVEQADIANTHVIDYAEIKIESAHAIAAHFGFVEREFRKQNVANVFGHYSKSAGFDQTFTKDSVFKQSEASAQLRNEARMWTSESYMRLSAQKYMNEQAP